MKLSEINQNATRITTYVSSTNYDQVKRKVIEIINGNSFTFNDFDKLIYELQQLKNESKILL